MSEDKPYNKREMDLMLKEIHTNSVEIKDHLAKLNGQTAKNTDFRLKTEGIIGLIKFIGFANILAWIAAVIAIK